MVDASTKSGKAAVTICVVAMCSGVGVLADWLWRQVFLSNASFVVPVHPVTALVFVFAGISLGLSIRADGSVSAKARRSRLLARASALVPLGSGLGMLIIIGAGWRAPFDRWIFAAHPAVPHLLPPCVALSHLVFGAALWWVGRAGRRLRFGVEIAAFLVGFVSLLSLLAVIYGIDLGFGLQVLMPMPPAVALVCLALAFAMLLTHTDDGFLKVLAGDDNAGVIARRLLPTAVLTPAILGWVAFHGEIAHWYQPGFGEAAEVVSNIGILAFLICWSAQGLIVADRQRKQAEASAHQSEGRFAGAFERAPIGVAIVSPDGRWLRVNPALCDLVGYSEQELLTRTFQDITHPEDMEIGREEIRRILAGETRGYSELEKRYIHRDGRVLTVVVSTTFVRDEQGESGYFITQIQDITERKHAEEELRWKTAFLEAQINSSPDGTLVVNPQGKLIFRNQRFIDLWNIPPGIINAGDDDELQLRWCLDKIQQPDTFLQKIEHLNNHPNEMSRDEVVFRDGTVLDRYSAPVIGDDGTRYGRIWTFRDITKRKQTEESLRESEARYLRIAANVPGMVYRFVMCANGSNCFKFVSEGCRDVFGLDPATVQHDAGTIFQAIHPDEQADFQRSIADATAVAGPWSWQGRIRRADTGEIRCVEGSSRAEREPNGDISWDGVIVDVTQRKRAEEDRRAKEEAERTNRAKSKFLSRMSHELRTPLNAILGFGQVLEFSKLKDEDAQALRFILHGGRHLLALVDEVLDLSRAETGELHLTPTRVNARKIVHECVGLVTRLAEARKIKCIVKGPGDHDPLWCDEVRLRQTLLNLLSNAIKYNRDGGKVFVVCERMRANRLRIKIVDTGPGIASEDLPRLFVPFERMDHENGEIEGTGLGLVVSRHIAEAMDGSIGVESEVGRGSTFWIELPLAVAGPSAPADAGPGAPLPTASDATRAKATLLYIEDNVSNLQVIQMLMARHRPEWQFFSAKDGRKGLESARQHLPDLILLDLQMPGMPGEEVLAALRGGASTRDIPVIVLSADATGPSRERLLARGAHAYLSKPFEVEILLGMLDAALEKAEEACVSV